MSVSEPVHVTCSIEPQCGGQSAPSSGAVAGEEGGAGDLAVPGPVGVVHHRVEALIEPLPEDD